MNLSERVKLLNVPVTRIAKEAGLDRMTVHRALRGKGLQATASKIERVLTSYERSRLIHLLNLHRDWLNGRDEGAAPGPAAALEAVQ